jgi:hypothetical protein
MPYARSFCVAVVAAAIAAESRMLKGERPTKIPLLALDTGNNKMHRSRSNANKEESTPMRKPYSKRRRKGRQNTEIPSCSSKGKPWNAAEGKRQRVRS